MTSIPLCNFEFPQNTTNFGADFCKSV